MKSRKKKKYFIDLVILTVRYIGYLSPKLCAVIFSLIWFKVSKMRPHHQRQAWIDQCLKNSIGHRNKKINVYSRAPVSPRGRVVLMHGWSGRWDQLIEIANNLYRDNFEVIVFDFPSHGENSGDESDLFELSEFIKSVFDGLNLNSPIVICHSAGFLALAHAIRMREIKFSKLVTINSPSRFDYLIEASREKIGFSPKVDFELWKVIQKRVGVENPQAQLQTDHMSQFKSHHVFNIHDRDDKEVKFSELSKMKSMWPQARILETNQLGHNRILSHPEVIQQIMSFVGRIDERQ